MFRFKRAENGLFLPRICVLSSLRLLLFGGALLGSLVSSSFADSKMNTVLTYTNGTRITASSPVNGGTRYGRIIRLQHNGSANGTLIATYESWPNNFWFFKSMDDGLTWTQIGAPILSSIPNWTMKVEPDLFELPIAVGNLPAGTILLAGNCRTNDFNINSHRMEVWYSTNQCVTWHYRGVVDTSTWLTNITAGLPAEDGAALHYSVFAIFELIRDICLVAGVWLLTYLSPRQGA